MQAEHRAERVAVVDIDVHHGNGTQACFVADPTTFYASTHQVNTKKEDIAPATCRKIRIQTAYHERPPLF